MIENFEQAEKAMEKMENSAGNADKEMEIITQSLSYKFNALKETGVGIFQNLFTRGNVSVVVQALTAVLSVIEKITESAGLLGTMMIGGALAKGAASFIQTMRTMQTVGKPTFLDVLGVKFVQLSTKIKTLVGSLTLAKAAMIGFVAAAGIIAAVALTHFDKQNTVWTHAQEDMQKATEEYKKAQTELETLNSKQSDNANQAKSIATKYDVDTSGLATAEEIISKVRTENESGNIHLSLVDEAELNKLSSVNTELETQVKLQQQLVDVKQTAMVEATRKATQAEKTYWDEVRSRHGEGFFGLIASGFDYLNSRGTGEVVGEDGRIISDRETEKEKFDKATNKTTLGLAQQAVKDYESQKAELDYLNGQILSQTNVATDEQIKRRDELRDAIQETTQDVSDYLETLSEQAGVLAESPLVEDQRFVKGVKNLMLEFENIGKSEAEVALNNLNAFFDGSNGKNSIKKELEDAATEGKDLTKVINEMGLSLRDLGLSDPQSLEDYFAYAKESAKEAQDAINDYRVSAQDVEEAVKSTDKDADWQTIQGAYKTAKELEAEGRTGVDQFQTVAQFFSNENLAKMALQAKQAGGYAADVYQKAFKEASGKADRWFGENEAQSLQNFADDMQAKGLFEINKSDSQGLWDIESNFKNTAEAAKEMGVSVEAVETLLSGMEAYGYDFGDIKKSSEMFDEYQKAYLGLQQISEELGEGASRDKILDLLGGKDGFNSQYAKIEEDLTNLTEEKVIKIKFEYDLASLQMKIDEVTKMQENGYTTLENNAEKLTLQGNYIDKAEEGLGFNKKGIQLPVEYVASEESEEALREQLANTDDPDKKLELQARISNEQELRKQILDDFSDEHPEITPETDVSEINKELQKEYAVHVDAEVNSGNIDEYLSDLPGATITYTADVDGVESEISAVRNSDGTITYKAVVDGETVPVEELNKEGTITYTTEIEGDVSGSAKDTTVNVTAKTEGQGDVENLTGKIGEVPLNTLATVKAEVHGTENVSNLTSELHAVPSSTTATITVVRRTIHETVNRTVGNPVVDGTAHSRGTAYAKGTAFAQGNWGTRDSGVALGGELGRKYFASAYSNVCEKLII